MRRSIQRIRGSSRARQLKLTAAATLGLAILGGSTLYLLHRTMPVPMPPAHRSGTPMTADAPISAPAAATVGASLPGMPADSAVGPLPRAESAPVSLRVPMPSEPAERLDGAGGDRRTDDARTRRAARRDAGRGSGAGPTAINQEAARAAQGRGARSGWSGELEGGVSGPGDPYGSSAGTLGSTTASATAASAPALAPSAPQRLATLQQTQCGDSAFLMKLICSERVRLRFCQNRWNAHPDCMVEARTLTY